MIQPAHMAQAVETLIDKVPLATRARGIGLASASTAAGA
jgi:hypothetical protein